MLSSSSSPQAAPPTIAAATPRPEAGASFAVQAARSSSPSMRPPARPFARSTQPGPTLVTGTLRGTSGSEKDRCSGRLWTTPKGRIVPVRPAGPGKMGHGIHRDTWVGAMRAGAKAVAPQLIGVIPFGLVAGASPADGGLGVGAAAGFSTIVFAGASQLAAIDVLTHGGTVLVAVLAACTINLRMVLYSASLAPFLAKDKLRWRVLASYLLVDQVYAVGRQPLVRSRRSRQRRPRPGSRSWSAPGCSCGRSWQTTHARRRRHRPGRARQPAARLRRPARLPRAARSRHQHPAGGGGRPGRRAGCGRGGRVGRRPRLRHHRRLHRDRRRSAGRLRPRARAAAR